MLNLFLVPMSPPLKGNSDRHNPDSVVTNYVEIPQEIIESREELEALTDIMFINKLPFLVSIRKGTKFTTIEYLLKYW